jgi:hypothetical protein
MKKRVSCQGKSATELFVEVLPISFHETRLERNRGAQIGNLSFLTYTGYAFIMGGILGMKDNEAYPGTTWRDRKKLRGKAPGRKE